MNVTRRLPTTLLTLFAALGWCGNASSQTYQFTAEAVVDGSEIVNVLNGPRIRRAAGGFVVIAPAFDAATPTSGNDLIGVQYDLSGAPTGDPFLVHGFTSGRQANAVIAAQGDGSFIVVWECGRPGDPGQQDGDDEGIFAQRFDSSADPVGTEFQVNEYTTFDQIEASVAALSDGGYLIAWSSVNGGGGRNVFARRYDNTGAPLTGEFQVNSYTTGWQQRPSVVSTIAGGYALVWESYDPLGPDRDGSDTGIFGAVFDSAGVPVGTEFQVNAYTTHFQSLPRLLELAGGELAVAWNSASPTGDGTEVFARVLDAGGGPLSGDFQVNTYTTEDAEPTDMALLDNGDFLVVWTSGDFIGDAGADGDVEGIMARRFDATGAAAGTEFRVNAQWQGNQDWGSAAADGNDGFMFAWQSRLSPRGGRVTYACVDLSSDTDADGVGDACDACNNPGTQTISTKPKVRFKRTGINGTVDDDGFLLSGEFALPGALTFASLDPSLTPMRIRAQVGNGLVPLDVELPTGIFAGNGTAGWSINGQGNRWSFRDKTGAPANGIVAAKLQDRDAQTPGTVRLKIKGKNGNYPFHPDDTVVNVTLVLGDGAAGECVETNFVAADCRYGGVNTSFSCRQ